MHKPSKVESEETNKRIYNIAHKRVLENSGEINCSYCRYHRVENATRVPLHTSWKKSRNRQYKASS